MNRLLLSLLFALFSLGISAQNSVDGFMKIFGWVEKLDNNISLIVKAENQKQLARQLGYLQSDLDNFIDKKRKITDLLLLHCEDSEIPLKAIEKEVDDYNSEIQILVERFEKIRKTITFEEELYSITEKRIITVYRKPDSTQILQKDTLENNMMIQQPLSQKHWFNGLVAKDTLIDQTITRNKNEWKEVDFDDFLFEIKKSLGIKGGNMNYILAELSKGCNPELIREESEMAVLVLSNIKKEVRNIRNKVIYFEPE